MKKTWTLLSLTLALYGANSFGGTAGEVFEERSPWTGFYVGANAGYLWTASNEVRNLSVPQYANRALSPTSEIMAASLGRLGTRDVFVSSDSFIGGGQIGYNALILDYLVISLEAEFDGVAQSGGTTDFSGVVTSPGLGTHAANIAITKKLDYLGFVKGRLGAFLNPSVLIYGVGAFAYGGATFNTSYTVSNSQATLLPIADGFSTHNVLGGWGAGAGAEWAVTPCWSVKAEYMYYDLGSTQGYLSLAQNLATTPVLSFAASSVKSSTDFTGNTVRVGVNYHFG
ncbi:outer membrane beta-barrel protein [uncultured Legionella sp.]|uniref:outer membrane protein n=1 Tax=uncultured Legionella sp. TaxID=210934 RepID=UPI00262CCD0E|nr:outer membrane beta-barrel protein [uncultured Legionella sp.]